MGSQARILKSGKVSFQLDAETRECVAMAIRCRLYFDCDDLPHYLYYLLEESLRRLEKADGDRIQLRRSEYLAVFDDDVMKYLDEPVLYLVRQAVEIGPTLLVIKDAGNTHP